MPEFTTVSVTEAQLWTIPGRQGSFMNEYVDYIQQVPQGQAGKLRIGEEEKHPTVRRRLIVAATAMNIPLIIKRSGNDLYFWREEGRGKQPKQRCRYTRRGRVGAIIPDSRLKRQRKADFQTRMGTVCPRKNPLN
jgi:hypothetical protein